MRRFAVLSLVMGLVLTVAGPVAAQTQAASVDPSTGPAGTAVTVSVSGFIGSIDIEVHEEGESGPLLGAGATNGSGVAGISITIPAAAAVGPFTLYVCGIPCVNNEFSERATTIFTVTPPPPPTTTATTVTIPTPPPSVTVGPLETTTTTALPVGSGPCVIPSGARVIDFNAWDASMGTTEDLFGELQTAILDAGHPLYARQWERYVFSVYPPTMDDPSYLPLPRVNSDAFIAANPARDLYTSSPPKVMRLIDDTVWSLLPDDPAALPLYGQLDYFGFNVGFGHFGEGFETPGELVVELRVALMPMEMPDGTVLDQGAWDTVSITLGPGPQPVTHCLMALNTLGPTDRYSVFLIDILPRTVGGAPVHIPVDIDDLFYGVNESPIPPLVMDDPVPIPPPVPVVTTELTLPFIEQPIEPFEFPPSPYYLPWIIASVLVGLLIGAGAMWGLRRRT